MIAVILMTTTCSKPLSKSLSKAQLQEYVELLPDYPKRDTFTKEEQKRIAMVPKRLKDWAVGVIKYSNCIKYEICNTKGAKK